MEKKSKLFGLTASEIKHELENPEVNITSVTLCKNFFVVCWNSKVGFGQFHFTQLSNGQLQCTENENMSHLFVKAVLQKWIDGMRIDPILTERKKDGTPTV